MVSTASKAPESIKNLTADKLVRRNRPSIAADATELIGNTPLVKVPKFAKGAAGTLVLKLEEFTPGFSVKDRIAVAMIDDAENRGIITPGKTTLVEPTSGNTGIGLAWVAAAKGYRLILTMPESMSLERRVLLLGYGAELVLTPPSEGMAGAVKRAEAIAADIPDSWIPGQFDQPGQPGNPPHNYGGRDLGGHRRRGRHRRRRYRHRRHDHRRRPGPQAAQASGQGRRSRADRVASALRRQALARTRSRVSAQTSCRTCSTPRSTTRSCTVSSEDSIAAARELMLTEGLVGRHLERRRGLRRPAGGSSRGEPRQADRCRPSGHRRALPEHSPLPGVAGKGAGADGRLGANHFQHLTSRGFLLRLVFVSIPAHGTNLFGHPGSGE